jgi:hypothetical protein
MLNWGARIRGIFQDNIPKLAGDTEENTIPHRWFSVQDSKHMVPEYGFN